MMMMTYALQVVVVKSSQVGACNGESSANVLFPFAGPHYWRIPAAALQTFLFQQAYSHWFQLAIPSYCSTLFYQHFYIYGSPNPLYYFLVSGHCKLWA